MMSLALDVLSEEYRQAAEYLADLDLDAQTVMDTLDAVSGELADKVRNVAVLIRNQESMAGQIKAAVAQMAKLRKAVVTRSALYGQYLLDNMQHARLQKVDCPYFNVVIRTNP